MSVILIAIAMLTAQASPYAVAPALETYEVVQDDDTFAVVFARTRTVVQLDGVPQFGLALDRADDVADYREAIDAGIAAARRPACMTRTSDIGRDMAGRAAPDASAPGHIRTMSPGGRPV